MAGGESEGKDRLGVHRIGKETQMTSDEFLAARKTLGLSRPELAVALGLKGDHCVKTIERIEGGATVTGPMALAIQKLLGDHQSGIGTGRS